MIHFSFAWNHELKHPAAVWKLLLKRRDIVIIITLVIWPSLFRMQGFPLNRVLPDVEDDAAALDAIC